MKLYFEIVIVLFIQFIESFFRSYIHELKLYENCFSNKKLLLLPYDKD